MRPLMNIGPWQLPARAVLAPMAGVTDRPFRILARKDGAKVRLITRNGYDLAHRFPLAVAAMAALPAGSCWTICRPAG